MKDDRSNEYDVDVTSHWSVWRIDDNGNVFLVREQLTEADARKLATDFEARGHKQMYWVAEESWGR